MAFGQNSNLIMRHPFPTLLPFPALLSAVVFAYLMSWWLNLALRDSLHWGTRIAVSIIAGAAFRAISYVASYYILGLDHVQSLKQIAFSDQLLIAGSTGAIHGFLLVILYFAVCGLKRFVARWKYGTQ